MKENSAEIFFGGNAVWTEVKERVQFWTEAVLWLSFDSLGRRREKSWSKKNYHDFPSPKNPFRNPKEGERALSHHDHFSSLFFTDFNFFIFFSNTRELSDQSSIFGASENLRARVNVVFEKKWEEYPFHIRKIPSLRVWKVRTWSSLFIKRLFYPRQHTSQGLETMQIARIPGWTSFFTTKRNN